MPTGTRENRVITLCINDLSTRRDGQSVPRPGHFFSRIKTQYTIAQEASWASGLVWVAPKYLTPTSI